MKNKTFHLKELEYIELNKILKIFRLVNSGGEANKFIDQGEVFVNGTIETRRRKKLKNGDIISFQDISIKII